MEIMAAEKPARGEPSLIKDFFFPLQKLQVASGNASNAMGASAGKERNLATPDLFSI